jgi:hypothetical protein
MIQRIIKLTDDQIVFYHREGYLAIAAITTQERVAKLHGIYGRQFAQRAGREKVKFLQKMQRFYPLNLLTVFVTIQVHIRRQNHSSENKNEPDVHQFGVFYFHTLSGAAHGMEN